MSANTSTQLKFEPYTEARRQEWDAYVLNHPQGWFWHTSHWIEYCVAYRDGNENLSFFVEEHGEVVGVVALIKQGDEFNAGGDPLPMFLVSNDVLLRQVLEYIDCLIIEYSVLKASFRTLPGGICLLFSNMGGWRTQIVDLTLPIETLWANIRKSYHSLIHKTEKTFNIWHSNNQLRLLQFKSLHAAQAGTKTRSDDTWFLMRDWLEMKFGIMVVVKDSEDRLLACAYFICYKNSVYYASAAYQEKNLAHGLIWYATKYFKNCGFRWLELGWTDRAGESEKEKNISFFKKGFKGEQHDIHCFTRTI